MRLKLCVALVAGLVGATSVGRASTIIVLTGVDFAEGTTFWINQDSVDRSVDLGGAIDIFPGKDPDRVAWLVDNAIVPTLRPGSVSALDSSNWVTSFAQAAGIQVAIWDIAFDGGDGLSTGTLQASTTAGQQTDPMVLAWAQTYEYISVGTSSSGAVVDPSLVTSGPMLMGSQFGGPQLGGTSQGATPEPGTYLMAGGALVGLGMLGARRARGGRNSR
jgi:hypothetical protein